MAQGMQYIYVTGNYARGKHRGGEKMNDLLKKALKSKNQNVEIKDMEGRELCRKVAGFFGISYFLGETEIEKEEFYDYIESTQCRWTLY